MCLVIVMEHWSCPKLHQYVQFNLWHLIASEEKLCCFKFNMQHKWVPVIFVMCVLRAWRGIGGKWTSVGVAALVRLYQMYMRYILPSRMAWTSWVHCEGACLTCGAGDSSQVETFCLGHLTEPVCTLQTCCVKLEELSSMQGQRGHGNTAWVVEDMRCTTLRIFWVQTPKAVKFGVQQCSNFTTYHHHLPKKHAFCTSKNIHILYWSLL